MDLLLRSCVHFTAYVLFRFFSEFITLSGLDTALLWLVASFLLCIKREGSMTLSSASLSNVQ